MHPWLRRYVQTQALHLNGNVIAASLTGTGAAALVASLFGSAGASAAVISLASTLANAVVFVPVHLGLHAAVLGLRRAAAPGTLGEAGRYWREIRLIYATGAVAIVTFLALFGGGQRLMLQAGLRPTLAVVVAYGLAQVAGRVVHTLLVWLSGRSPKRVSL